MNAVGSGADVLLLVPVQPQTAHVVDPMVRQTLGAHLGTRLTEAVAEFEAYLGHSLGVLEWTDHPLLHGLGTAYRVLRSLTAVTLATHLEKHRLDWACIDPGMRELGYWRKCLERVRSRPPRVVALSTTFVMSGPWLRSLCALVRRILPSARLVIGGCFYLTSLREFLSLDADVLCLGEGEVRLPQIVRAVLDGAPVEDVPGLYCRGADDCMRYTGPAAPLDFDRLDRPDWGLAGRIDPPVDLAREPSFYSVETQRGCVYRCEFCTYRTLTAHQAMSAEHAVGAIMDTAALPPGRIFLIDATATTPRKRWEEVLRLLVERGGSPHPMVAFSRVSDVTEPLAGLMARAGVIGVVIGQESGDQPILDAMKKGTRVEQVAPAVAALARHGIGAQCCFIHGFPGESAESIAGTRAMIAGLNRGFEDRPVVTAYNLCPFSAFDFAAVTRRDDMPGTRHFLGYESAEFSPQRVAEEMLDTLIAVSGVPGSPVCSILFNGLADHLYAITDLRRRMEIYRWLKAFERGLALFVRRDLHGTPPDEAELRGLRREVLAHCRAGGPVRQAASRMMSRARARQSRRLRGEWLAERERGPGRVTRNIAAFLAWRGLGRMGDAAAAWKAGSYPDRGPHSALDRAGVEALSDKLLFEAVGRA